MDDLEDEGNCFGYPSEFCKWDGCPRFEKCLRAEKSREALNKKATTCQV